MELQNKKPFSLSGPITYRIINIVYLIWASVSVIFKRLFRGPKVPGWTQSFEISNAFLRMQFVHAFDLKNIEEGRRFFDSLTFYSVALNEVRIEQVTDPVDGIWLYPAEIEEKRAILYFHGGGYAYFARAHMGFLANIVKFTELPVFTLDYPLIPESAFPAQLEYATKAYKWLIENGYPANVLTVMGDSAGGNLCLALLLKLKEMDLPMPCSAVALCPWTDVANSGESMTVNEPFDWVEKRMADRWAEWFLCGRSPDDPLISPLWGNFRNLSPIYVQAGGKEILIDMIKEFYQRSASLGASIQLDVWDSMPHDFQAYGDVLAEAREALSRISQFIHSTEYAA